MKKAIYLLFVCIVQHSIAQEIPITAQDITTAISNKEEQIEDVYYNPDIYAFYKYFKTNFDTSVLLENNKKDEKTFFYIKFAIDENGKPTEYEPVNIEETDPRYQETKRVVESSIWVPAKKNGAYQKQFIVLPVRLEAIY